MKEYSKKALALLLTVTLVLSNGIYASAQESQATPPAFSTSFEDSTDFIQSTVDKDSQNADRIQNVSGSASEQMIGDITKFVVQSSIAGSGQISDTESKVRIIDSNTSTKWLSKDNAPSTTAPIWISFQIQAAKAVQAYSIVSANDSSERDPKDWNFYGSDNGSTWTVLDTQSGITFANRFQQKIFQFENSTAYQYYKLEITANAGDAGMTQFSDMNIATLDSADGVPAMMPMNTTIGTGPASTWNQKANAGWTGSKALTVSGSQLKNSDGGYCYNVIYDNLSIPVKDNTKLSYVIFPQYVGDYDFDYTSMHIAVDLEFSDGTYLSQSGAVDQNGNIVSPLEQGKSRTLTTRQWNKISTYLNTGNLSGKTITKILVGYQNDQVTTDQAANFLAYIDDISITESAPKVYDHLSDYVNILRGTNDSSSFSRGLTAPAVTVPHGFNFWAPVTKSNDNKMYNYQDNTLSHITISHEPSYWVGDRGTWQFMVNTSLAAGSSNIGTDARAAKFSHDNETAKSYYYSVRFTEGNAAGSRIELSPTDHAAAVKFTFNDTAENRNVIFDSVRADGALSYGSDNKSFTARTDHTSNGMQSMYIYGEFDTAFVSPNVISGKSGMVSFPEGTKTVTLKVASSFISADQAKKNMESEIGTKSFDDVYQQAQKTWDDQLGIVEIEGATESQLTTFYSSMYRLFAYPNLLSEQTGAGAQDGWQYRSPYGDHGVVDGKLYYNNGFWDTYRTTWAAYALLTPSKDSEMLNGLVQHYKDQDWMPRWIAPGGTDSMVGTSSDVIFGDAINRGIQFDVDDAYLSALKNGAVVSDNSTNGGRKGLQNSIFDGYTSNSIGEGMSWSMEGYINDYGIAQLAKYKGDTDEYKYYLNRAQNYTNLFSLDLGGWFSGKSRSGFWSFGKDDFDPTRWGGDYTETNAWNMAFSVPQDGQGLANLYGGRENLAKKLDTFFTTQGTFNPGGYGGEIHEMKEAREIKLGQYGHSNQPSHHIPYMYDYAGRPDRTQQVVRDILARVYVGSDFGQGYIGDEDNGEMSAWYVFSALGFYPLSMGNPEFAIGSPLFTKATIHLESGKDLVINAPNNSKENVYVQSVKLNGQDYDKCYFLHSDLAKGGTIDFDMGSKPSAWGSSEDAMPTSITQGNDTPKPIADMTSLTPAKLDAAPTESVKADSVYSAESGDVAKLFDNDSGTTATFTPSENGTASVYYSFSTPVYVNMYTLTSGTDKSKAPSSFKLYGSDDCTTWNELDSRSNITFDWNKYTRPFSIADDKTAAKYQHYRLDMSNGTGEVEVAEMELLGDFDKAIDRDYLKTLILQASSLDTSNSPNGFVQELNDAIAAAKTVWNDSETTNEEIHDAAIVLKNAITKISAKVRDAYVQNFEAESYDQTKGISTDSDQPDRSGNANIGGVQDGEWVKYNNVDFGNLGASHINISYASSNYNNEAVAGRVEVVLDSLDNQPAATVPTHTTGSGWGTYVLEGTDISPAITGVHDVYLRFYSQAGKYVANVDYIQFTENPVTIDNLKAVVQQTTSLTELNYTAESWNNLQNALTKANEVITNEAATQDEIEQAVSELKAAIKNLKYVGSTDSPNFKTDLKYGSIVNQDSASFQILTTTDAPLVKVQIKKDGKLVHEYTADDLILMDTPDAITGNTSEQVIYNLDLDLTDKDYGDGRYDISAVMQDSTSTFRFIRDTEDPVITVDEDAVPPTATIEESHLDTVTVNGDAAELTNGKLTFAKTGSYEIVATDKAGNTATATVTANTDFYKIAVAASTNGTVTPAVQYVKEGDDSAKFTIKAASGYKVSNISISTGDILSISDDKTSVIVKTVSDDAVITVTYQRIKSNSHHSSTDSNPAPTQTPSEIQTSTGSAGNTIINVTPAPSTGAVVNGGTSSLSITVPSNLAGILSAAVTGEKKTEAKIAVPSDALIAQLNNSAATAVQLNVNIPAQVITQTHPNVNVTLTIPQAVLNTARQTQKDITVNAVDSATNLTLYSWTFKGSDLAKYQDTLRDINIALVMSDTASDSNISSLVSSAGKGLLLNFADHGTLPVPATVRIFAVDRFFGGQTLYLYYYNSETKQLETVDHPAYTIDSMGYANIVIDHCSQYVLLPKQVPAATPIRLDTGKTLTVKTGKTYQFKVTASAKPTFTAGTSSAFKVIFSGSNGNDYFFKVTATGKPGQGSGFYVNGEKSPRTIGKIVA